MPPKTPRTYRNIALPPEAPRHAAATSKDRGSASGFDQGTFRERHVRGRAIDGLTRHSTAVFKAPAGKTIVDTITYRFSSFRIPGSEMCRRVICTTLPAPAPPTRQAPSTAAPPFLVGRRFPGGVRAGAVRKTGGHPRGCCTSGRGAPPQGIGRPYSVCALCGEVC